MISADKYMQRCLELAALGLGHTAPNPLVGSVVVLNDQIVGEGYHEKFGGHHAEVNAIHAALKVITAEQLKSATLFVNLEPCSHFGKTPPCTDAIIHHGIPRVVVGSLDPFQDAAGRGVQRLQKAGIEVKTGVCTADCEELNKRFITFHKRKRPYIIIKFARSADGFIAPYSAEKPRWISNEWSRRLVHKWRTEEPGIMVGSSTVLLDNPQLTARDWPGKQPLRIVIDRKGTMQDTMQVMDKQSPSIIFTCSKKTSSENCAFVQLKNDANFLEHVFSELHERSIQSVMVEGGARLINALTQKGLWDEARIFTSPLRLENGLAAPEIVGTTLREERIVGDTLTYITPHL